MEVAGVEGPAASDNGGWIVLAWRGGTAAAAALNAGGACSATDGSGGVAIGTGVSSTSDRPGDAERSPGLVDGYAASTMPTGAMCVAGEKPVMLDDESVCTAGVRPELVD